MDAGVPIKEPVTGISIGLVKEGQRYCLFTDIQGLEDFFGDMDFKVTRTKNGITAIQLDVKTQELTLAILAEALEKAQRANAVVLKKILSVISVPRPELSPYAPRVIMLTIDPSKIGELIGPGGKVIKKITEETGVKIDIEDDGRVFVFSTDGAASEEALKRIRGITCEVEVGQIYTGEVTRIVNFGAFVQIAPNKEGLVHISQLANRRVNRVEDVVAVGDKVKVKVSEIDELGRINLTMKNVS
jgi:polyribonucleotide nucleotidyltransferase